MNPIKIIECGCCDCYHRADFHGDCRDDSNRFGDPQDAADCLQAPVILAYEEKDEIITSGPVIMPVVKKSVKARKKFYVDATIRVVVECDEDVDAADILSYANYEIAYDGDDGKILETEMESAECVGECDTNGVLIPLTCESQTPDEDDVDDNFNGDLEDK